MEKEFNKNEEELSFKLLEIDLVINKQNVPVIRYFCFFENKLYHVNCPKQTYIKINGQNKNLPSKIYMTENKMSLAHPIHKRIENHFNI